MNVLNATELYKGTSPSNCLKSVIGYLKTHPPKDTRCTEEPNLQMVGSHWNKCKTTIDPPVDRAHCPPTSAQQELPYGLFLFWAPPPPAASSFSSGVDTSPRGPALPCRLHCPSSCLGHSRCCQSWHPGILHAMRTLSTSLLLAHL